MRRTWLRLWRALLRCVSGARAARRVATFQRGFDITKREQEDGEYPVVSSSGATGDHSQYRVLVLEVVIGRKGKLVNLLLPARTILASRYYSVGAGLPWERPAVRVLLGWCAPIGRARLRGIQPDVNRNHIHRCRCACQHFPYQRRIAQILAAYDDLIENNLRRIRILEEMARTLYREWFVEFRYPGHEKAKFVETEVGRVPKGWDVTTIGDLADRGGGTVRTGPFGSQLHESDYTTGGTPVVMPKNLLGSRIDTSDIARIPDEMVAVVSQHRLTVGDIVYGRRGDIGRRAYVGTRQVG